MGKIGVENLVLSRHSVRTYREQAIPKDHMEAIREKLKEESQKWLGSIRVELIHTEDTGKEKLGTYGVIKGAKDYMVGIVKDTPDSKVILGYVLEKVVLFCTSLGLGTVWLGGTYSKGQFANAVNLQSNERIMVVIPVGYEAEKKALIAKLMGNHNGKRKPFEQLFFLDTEKIGLSREKAGVYEKPLEMLRMAPSAVNGQPWRVIKKDDAYHFYITNVKGLHEIDIGIGLAHFQMTAKENKLTGEFVRNDPKISTSYTYVVSWVME